MNLFALSRTATQYDTGLSTNQVLIKRAAERFITAVNSATGSLITASSTDKFNVVILTQNIPGTAGNTTNSYVTDGEFVVENFTGGNSGTVRYPFGISIGSAGEVLDRVLSTDVSGTLDVPTSGKAGLLSAYSDQHPYGVFQPYDESSADQAFGVNTGGSRHYGTQARLSDEFFTRGSISGSLDEPLWVKDKIVIDLVPNSETSLLFTTGSSTNGPSSNFPMAYFNFSTKRWEPIGFGYGRTTPAGATTLQENLERQYIGFSQGWGNFADASSTAGLEFFDRSLLETYTGTKSVFQETGWLTPIDTFGFPLHPKYHATGSQQLEASSLVDRPFLVEKIVYEFSASMPNLQSKFESVSPGREYRGGAGAFFILNQRKANPDPGQENSYTNSYVSEITGLEFGTPQDGGIDSPSGDYYRFHYENGGIPQQKQLATSGPTVYVNTVRDLVTFARIGTVWDEYDEEVDQILEPGFPHPAMFMDLAISVPATGTFSGKYTLSAPVRTAVQNSAVSNIALGTPTVSPNNISSIYASKDSLTRNSIDVASGRAIRGEFFSSEISYRVNGVLLSKKLFSPKTDSAASPYLIMPGDQLVFGWQSSMYFALGALSGISDALVNSAEKTLKILPGAGKLTLYGSYLRDDKPVHDIYKDQLNSDAIHEALPAGPWVLDRFESEPQMMYSSSMREEHVTGTMVTRGADGSLVVTDVNDLGIGGVRAVSARVSDGTVGARWSFFRNNRIFDEQEQYYDSMQPNPLDVLFSDPNVKAFLLNASNIVWVPLMLPGETLQLATGVPNTQSAFNQYSNRSFFMKFPFDQSYSNISRTKKINSSVLSGKRVPVFTIIGADSVFLRESIIDGAVTFVTGTNGSQISNFSKKGGLYTHGEMNFSGLIPALNYAFTSQDDTNPTRSNFLVADKRATDESTGVNYWLSRFMGCFGDGYLRIPQLSNFGTTSFGGLFSTFTNLRYRGTKHGLVNPTPLFSSAVFSGTRYGQLRDMMEQRQYTRFSLSNNTLTNSAVSVEFINRSAAPGTLNITSGSATNSSNISQFATSEHPYDDALSDYEQIWDRSTVLPETLTAL